MLPVDIVTQILNFGLPAPIDIQVVGPNLEGNRAFADRLMNEIKICPGQRRSAHPAAVRQSETDVDVDRTLAESRALQQRDVAQSLLIAISGSFQTSPTFCLDPRNGVELQHRRADATIQLDTHAGPEKYSRDRREAAQELTARTARMGAPPGRRPVAAADPDSGNVARSAEMEMAW